MSSVAQAVQEVLAPESAQVLQFPSKPQPKKVRAKKIGGLERNRDGVTAYETKRGVRFLAQVRVAGRAPMSKSFDDREEAIRWKKANEAKLLGAKPVAQVPSKMTVAELCVEYERLSEEKGKPLSYSRAQHYKRLAAHSFLKGILVSEIDIDVMRNFCEVRINADGAKPSTVLCQYAYLKVAIKRVARWLKWGAFDPLAGGRETLKEEKLLAESTERTRRPSDEELQKLLAYFAENQGDIPMGDIVSFAALNAFRRGEITELLRSEFDADNRLVGCRRKYSAAADNSGKRDALVPLRAASLEIIARQPVIEGEDRIFPFNADTISGRFTDACTKLGIEDLRFHDLRHEAISRAAQTPGITQAQLKAFSGHKSDRHLARYINNSKEDIRAIAGILG